MMREFGIILPWRRYQPHIAAFSFILLAVAGILITARLFFPAAVSLFSAVASVRPSSAGFLRRAFFPGWIHCALSAAITVILCPAAAGIVSPSATTAKQQY